VRSRKIESGSTGDSVRRSITEAVGRHGGGLEKLGHLGRGPSEHVTQDQHRALAARQLLDRPQQGQLHALADRVAGCRIVGRRCSLLAGPVWERVDRLGPAGAPLKLVQTGVGGDPVEPRLKLCTWLEPVQCPPRSHQRLLGQVLRVVRRSEHPVAVHIEGTPIRLDEPAEGALIAGLRGGQQEALVMRDVVGHERSPVQTTPRDETHRSNLWSHLLAPAGLVHDPA
jgi:hypothetical protein